MKYPVGRLLLLVGYLLISQVSWAQESSAALADLNLVLGAEPYSQRTHLREEMQTFADTHRLHLLITLLDEKDIYQSYAREEETRLLGQSAPALTITTWHQRQGMHYLRCEVQVNAALATRLPQATAQQLVEEMLDYYGEGDMLVKDAMYFGLSLALARLSEYLAALPPPEAVPTITFAAGHQSPLGLDAFRYEAHRPLCEQVIVQEEPYPVSWQTLPSGQTTSVLAQVDKGISFPPGVVFKQNGNTIASQPAEENHQQQLTLTGQTHEQEGVVEVYESQAEDAPLVGKLNTISYDALYQKLVLVVLDDVLSDPPYLANLSAKLQAIYAQAGVNLTVEHQEFDTGWGDRGGTAGRRNLRDAF